MTSALPIIDVSRCLHATRVQLNSTVEWIAASAFFASVQNFPRPDSIPSLSPAPWRKRSWAVDFIAGPYQQAGTWAIYASIAYVSERLG